MPVIGKKRLGDLLVRSGSISQEQLKAALKEQKSTGARLGHILVSSGLMTREDLLDVLSSHLNIPIVNLEMVQPPPELLRAIPEATARKHTLFPIERVNGRIRIAMADPLDLAAVDEISAKLSLEIDTSITSENQILNAIDSHYGFVNSAKEAMLSAPAPSYGPGSYEFGPMEQDHGEAAPPIAKLVEAIIRQGVADRASDIHIEPGEDSLRVRYRIDGVMFGSISPEKELEAAIISRIKIMSKIDIAETRVPQDGRFRMKIDGKNLELRVSTFPTIYGEAIVLRILNRENILMGLEETGLCGGTLDDFKNSILKRQGIIIVTGPTGSGKTTTLYSCLNMLNSPEKTIVTIEDPVEYRLKYVRQTQVNPKGGLTFARGLRSILRQDPDVIMVGEIRDPETAQIATRAAMTGHLVLSTMHTGASIDVIARLKDLGMETCLIVSTLKGVLAQRLVRKICAKCGTENSGLDTQVSGLPMAAEKTAVYGRRGCVRCKSSGYFGRIGIFEFLKIDDKIQDMVVKGERPSSIRKFVLQSGAFTTMRDDGLSKARSGVTTLEEVEKATCEN